MFSNLVCSYNILSKKNTPKIGVFYTNKFSYVFLFNIAYISTTNPTTTNRGAIRILRMEKISSFQ